MIVPHKMVIIGRDTIFKSSVQFFLHDTVSLKSTIVLVIGHFLTSVKFRKIPWQYQSWWKMANSAAWLKIPHPTENCGPYLFIAKLGH